MATGSLIFDKYAVIEKLEKRGFTHEQAAGIAEVLAEPDASALATKLDLQVLKTDLRRPYIVRPGVSSASSSPKARLSWPCSST